MRRVARALIEGSSSLLANGGATATVTWQVTQEYALANDSPRTGSPTGNSIWMFVPTGAGVGVWVGGGVSEGSGVEVGLAEGVGVEGVMAPGAHAFSVASPTSRSGVSLQTFMFLILPLPPGVTRHIRCPYDQSLHQAVF